MNVGMDDRRWSDSCGIKEVFGNRCSYGSGVEEFIRGLITVHYRLGSIRPLTE